MLTGLPSVGSGPNFSINTKNLRSSTPSIAIDVDMSCYFRQDCEITVPEFRTSDTQSVTYYDIKIKVGQTEWFVSRRYKDFDNLNEKLIEEISISKKLLPPKKVFKFYIIYILFSTNVL